MTRRSRASVLAVVMLLCAAAVVRAHSGPPFPIVSNQIVGAYSISIWTDPDTTDDGQPAGQFWVVVDPADDARPIPGETRASIAIRPLDRPGATQSARTEPVNGAVGRQFAVLLMDHEGPYDVRVTVEGPLGLAEVASHVDATYDLRPARGLIVLYLFPFVVIGALWAKVLLRRRRLHAPRVP
ncbi:MAG: hypothetical protein QM736_00820 [Vicinamibacterales bacterium]